MTEALGGFQQESKNTELISIPASGCLRLMELTLTYPEGIGVIEDETTLKNSKESISETVKLGKIKDRLGSCSGLKDLGLTRNTTDPQSILACHSQRLASNSKKAASSRLELAFLSNSSQSEDLGRSKMKPNTVSDAEVLMAKDLYTRDVGTVFLYGIRIVSLSMDGKERLCLAQISNTLLKEYSYNEIHNRRVALGITCVQCTPVQLEILRRAGAMPISSRRCGMITKREAERLCKSFLGDNAPPKLPENFAFEVFHECAWGCRGQFVPARYNSSRAKCIKCHICGVFFSPNKFVFHSHRMAESDKYVQPDAANFNSWRRHTKLLGDPPEEIVHAWEDIKAMFNGGTRKRMMSNGGSHMSSSAPGSMAEHGPFAKEMKMESEYKSKQAQEMAGSGFDQSDMGIFGRNHVPPSFPYFAPFHNLDPMALMSGSGFPNIEPKPKPETKTPSHMDAAWPSQNALRPYPGHWNPFHYPFLWPKNPFLASGHGSMDDMEGHKKAPNQEGSSTFDLNSWLEQRRHLSDEMG
eukprot:maker-scaffold206_size259025-snap-gene-0.10 protein:Tk10927 transcript:maker-scaffold206_size259025-snap-gene-0.10-mRNA-1 annotation:"hypothetical protein SINV_02441"